MKFPPAPVQCFGIKQSDSEFEGKKYSSTTFYLPADLAESASGKTLGVVTVPYKFGDSAEFERWAHLKSSFPAGGIACLAEFELVAGKDAQGKDSGKLALVGIRLAPAAATRSAA